MPKKFVLSTVIALLCFGITAFADIPQKEKRIYLVDVTSSMRGQGAVETPNIFETVKDNLIETLQEITDTTIEIDIIPFTNRVHKGINACIAKRDTLINFIHNLDIRPGDTNIADAWSYGVSRTDTTKINYLFILTDGLHNCGPSKSVLYQRLSDWEKLSANKYFFAFYVMLTKNAEESEIRRIADETRNMWKIEGLNINASLLKTEREIRKNIFMNKAIYVSFISNNQKLDLNDTGIRFSLENNPYYVLTEQNPANTPGTYRLVIKENCSKSQIPVCDTLKLAISHDDEKYPFVFITPDIVTLEISNVGARNITALQNENPIGNDINFGEVQFKEPLVGIFGKFSLFRRSLKYWPYSLTVPDTTSISSEIRLIPNEDAIRSGASVRLSICDKYGQRIVTNQAIAYSDSTFMVSKDTSVFHFTCTAIPALKDTIYSGYVLAGTVGVDAINDHEVHSSSEKIAYWQCTQVIEPNFPAWILWSLSIVIALALLVLLLGALLWLIYKLGVLLYEAGKALFSALSRISFESRKRKNRGKRATKQSQKQSTDDPLQEINCDCIEEALKIENALYQNNTVVAKYDLLESLRLLIDSYWEEGQPEPTNKYRCGVCKFCESEHCRHDLCKEVLKSNTWDALEGAWRLSWPKEGLIKGTSKNHYTYTITESNPHYKECKSKNFLSCQYDEHGSPNFDDITIPGSIVDISDLYDTQTIEQISEPGKGNNSIQYIAQIQRMMPQLETTIRKKLRRLIFFKKKEIKEKDFWEWRDNNKLVPHADTNCRTMRLVYRPAHEAFVHRGGIANAINIKKHFPNK